MKEPKLKTARKGKDVETAQVKDLTIDSTKNHLKLVGKYTITLDEAL